MNLQEAAKSLDRVKELEIVKAWELKAPPGTKYTDPWIERSVDPIFIDYDSKSLQLTIAISTRMGDTIVKLTWNGRKVKSWDESGPTETEILWAIEKAIKLCEFSWNEHVMRPEGGYARVSIHLDV